MPDFSKPEEWKRLEEVFYRALEVPVEDRARFLDEACGDDSALRQEVQSLLDATSQPPGFLASPIETAARAYCGGEAAMQLQPGRAFGNYQVISLLGAGGMGQVYLAEDTRLGRRVALKTLPPDVVGDLRDLHRFEQEARAASALNHPNILTIYEVGECEGVHFIASEFIEGPTLRQHLHEGSIGVRRAVDLAVQIVSGLTAAHAAGIVHRDIKPENILIRADGIAKIVDFGIAKLNGQQKPRRMLAAASGPSSPTTQTGMRLGTPRYMSPEQARGLAVDARTDIFSTGVVIYEMVAGKAPFEGATDSDVVAELLKTDPPPLDQVAADVPPELSRILATAMCKDREGRYQDAAAMLAELKALQNDLGFQARLRTESPAIAAPRRTSRRAVLAIGVVVAALVAGFLGWKQFAKPAGAVPHRLAILPFRNIKPDPATDFLGFSLADAVITKLGYISSVTVIPSSAIEEYRNRTIDPRQAAAALSVDTLLMGSYVKDGNDLRITAQLIDVKPLKILWRDTIDLAYGKLLTVDDRVAEKIISGLELTLTPSETEHLKLDVPRADAAYEDYLRGVDLYSINDFDSSIAMLEKSVALDPTYALAWAHLGQAYEANASLQFGGREQNRKALEAYQRALKLNPALIEPRVYMANLFTDTGRVEDAVPLLREALETNRNSAGAHWEMGYAYRFAGLLEDSVRECERAREIDPSVKIASSAINAYFYLGRYDQLLASLPHSDAAYILFYRGFGEYYKHDYGPALEHFDRAFESDPELLQAEVGKALADGIRHDAAGGLRLLRATESKINERGVTDAEGIYKVAQAYAMLGDSSSAIRMLRQSIDGGFFPYPYFESDPLLNPIRDTRDFAALMDRARVRYEQFKTRFAP
jgi:serine/threonine protein kinase/Tfp pilus assembly protein PilF